MLTSCPIIWSYCIASPRRLRKNYILSRRDACLLFEPDEEDTSRHRLSAILRGSERSPLLEWSRMLMLFTALPYNRRRLLSCSQNVFSGARPGRGSRVARFSIFEEEVVAVGKSSGFETLAFAM